MVQKEKKRKQDMNIYAKSGRNPAFSIKVAR